MLIRIADIAEDPDNIRKVHTSAEQDRMLQASIESLGVIQPIMVRPSGSGYVVVAGARRLRAARAAGLEEIPAEIADIHNGRATAAATAENTVRAAMDPVDQWRAMRQLQCQGYTLQGAAQAIGVSELMARRMLKLADLAPPLLDAIVGRGLPSSRDLAAIASAPPELQLRAFKAAKKSAGDNDGYFWREVADKCTVKRISQKLAVFDIEGSGVTFEEDLFAEPGSDAQFTTTDIAGFMAAQAKALQARAAEAQAAKHAVEWVAWDEKGYGPVVPPGYVLTYDPIPKKLPKLNGDKLVLLSIEPHGYSQGKVVEKLAVRKAAAKAAAAKKAEKTRVRLGDADEAAEEDEEAPPPAPEKSPISQTGQDMVAAAKTDALHQALRAPGIPIDIMLACCIMALAAKNVIVRGYEDAEGTRGYAGKYHDIIAGLLQSGGNLALPPEPALVELAGEALARTLFFESPKKAMSSYSKHSGDAAEWIGHAVAADGFLPRFDTEAFLAEVTGAKLRELCLGVGLKPAGSVADTRRKLAGADPRYRPTCFGAPAPRIEAHAPHEDDPDDGDAIEEDAA